MLCLSLGLPLHKAKKNCLQYIAEYLDFRYLSMLAMIKGTPMVFIRPEHKALAGFGGSYVRVETVD